jgi:hypothetical protein
MSINETAKAVNADKQNRHIETNSIVESGRSYIYGNLETAQTLVNNYCGTGETRIDSKGNPTNKEFITLSHDIGVWVSPCATIREPTNRFAIHYGKTGSHVVPAKRE